MRILPQLEIIDLTLKYKDILIIGDIQLGYEQTLKNKGVLLPNFNLDEIIKRLEKIFAKTKIKKVLINGDVKHEFGKILNQEWRETTRLFDFLAKHVEEIILIKGNHDMVLGPIAEKRKITLVDSYYIDDLVILHGHKITPNLSKVIIIGHEHPAVSFPEKPYEKFKCFLKGNWKNHTLIVMPSFNFLTVGSDITKEQFLSPFLAGQNLDNYEVYAVDDKIYNFGRVKDIMRM